MVHNSRFMCFKEKKGEKKNTKMAKVGQNTKKCSAGGGCPCWLSFFHVLG